MRWNEPLESSDCLHSIDLPLVALAALLVNSLSAANVGQ